MFKDLLSIVFPLICPGCGIALLDKERGICTSCLGNLPINRTNRGLNPAMDLHYTGRIPVAECYSFLPFVKQSLVQNLLHQMKYADRPDVAWMLGFLFGKTIGSLPAIDGIVPVPLHKRRLKERGYNQSEHMAMGLGESLNIPLMSEVIERFMYTRTQTTRNREDRRENVRDAFRLMDRDLIKGRNILLIDDVFTTGATLESCGSALFEGGVNNITLAVLAMA